MGEDNSGQGATPKDIVPETSVPEVKIVSTGNAIDDATHSTGNGKICPPAYTTEDHPAMSPYTIPKDLSEGLPNPVFSNADEHGDTSPSSNPNQLTLPPTCTSNDSFTSLNSFGGSYASHTTLYRNDNLDLDTEKGSEATKGDPKKPTKGAKEYAGLKKYLGLTLTFLASFFFSVVTLFVKVLSMYYNFDAYGSSFWRYAGTVLPTIPLLLFFEFGPAKKKQGSVFNTVWPILNNDNWKTWIGLLARGIIGASSVILRYYALQYLTIADTSVITFSTPVLVTVLAHFFLGEKCGVFPVFIAFFTLCGVIIVTRPPIFEGQTEFDTNTLIGTGLACGSLVCASLIVIITRKIREVHFTVMTLVFGTIGVVQALSLIYFLGNFNMPEGLYDSLLVAGVAVLSFFGQMMIVLALKFENAGPVALVRSCDVLFGFLFQYFFLGVIPDVYSAVGGTIVLTGVLSVALRKWLFTLPEDDRRRGIFCFVLK